MQIHCGKVAMLCGRQERKGEAIKGVKKRERRMKVQDEEVNLNLWKDRLTDRQKGEEDRQKGWQRKAGRKEDRDILKDRMIWYMVSKSCGSSPQINPSTQQLAESASLNMCMFCFLHRRLHFANSEWRFEYVKFTWCISYHPIGGGWRRRWGRDSWGRWHPSLGNLVSHKWSNARQSHRGWVFFVKNELSLGIRLSLGMGLN